MNASRFIIAAVVVAVVVSFIFSERLRSVASLDKAHEDADAETSTTLAGEVDDSPARSVVTLNPAALTQQKEDEEAKAKFLQTEFEPLAKWLDDRFAVDFQNMTPQIIFDQVPLSDIYYDAADLPENARRFNFSHEKISRRDLLWTIAKYWHLDMAIVFDDIGQPRAVSIEARE